MKFHDSYLPKNHALRLAALKVTHGEIQRTRTPYTRHNDTKAACVETAREDLKLATCEHSRRARVAQLIRELDTI